METEPTILIVDDDPLTLVYIQRVLESGGYRVLSARDGAEALAMLRSESVDLILTDVMMPRINGYQFHSRLVQEPGWVMIPVIFMSARDLDSDVRYAKEMGVDDYLTKPVVPEDLLASVRGQLRKAEMRKQAQVRGESAPGAGDGAWSLGRLRIEPGKYRVSLDGVPIKLTPTEYKLLAYLAHRTHQTVPLEELVKSTHGIETDYTEASALLRPMVRSIRRKLGYRVGEMGCISSVRGIGYQLVPPTPGKARVCESSSSFEGGSDMLACSSCGHSVPAGS